MSRNQILIRYDGPELAGHSMSVDDLAPALLSLAELCKLANQKFNGDRASVNVFVNANLEQNCFELNLELVQTILSHAQSFITNENIATSKEILEWLGIITPTAAGTAFGLFKILKILRGRKIERRELKVIDNKNVYQLKIEGDNNNVYIYPETNQLIEDSRVIKNVQKVVFPLIKEGYEKLEFESDKGQKEEITKEEAEKLVDTDFSEQLDLGEDEPQVIIAWIRVHSPVYEKDAKNWRFEYGDKYETMDISETDIAEKAIERGGALVNDTYKVTLQITQTRTPSGRFNNRYKIKNVIEFRPSSLMHQTNLFD